MNDVIILCGVDSENTRIQPHLFEINGKTILEKILDSIVDVEINSVILSTYHMSNELISLCQNKLSKHVLSSKIRIFTNAICPGTGGAVKYASRKSNIKTNKLIISSRYLIKESMTDFISSIIDTDKIAIMGVQQNDVSGYHKLEIDIKNKTLLSCSQRDSGPGIIYSGVCWLSYQFDGTFPDSDAFSLETEVFTRLINAKTYISVLEWLDMTKLENISKARASFK